MTAARREKFVIVQEVGEAHDLLQAAVDAGNAMPDEEWANATDLHADIRRLTAQIDAEKIEGYFERLPFLRWQAVKDQFPPDEADKADGWDFSVSTEFFTEAIRVCMVEPALSDDEWAALDERLNKGDRFRLGWQVVALNDTPLSIPKAQRPLPETTPLRSASRRRRASA